jgi:putative membrane protein
VTAELARPHKRLSPLTPLVRGFYLVVAFAATSWDDALRGNLGPIGYILLALLVGGAVFGTASWLRTKYWIEGDELRVDTGLVSQQSRRIRVDRLQGVDIVQPFVARLFGLAELKMDVAGGGAAEGSLAFLPLSEAQQLRELLLARRDAVRAGARGTPQPAGPPAPDREIARLDLGLLVLSLLLSSETLAFLLSGAAFLAVFAVLGSVGGAAGVTPLLIGFGLALFRKLSGFYGFTVARTAAGLRVRRGLFELNAQTISLERVQGVVVTEPWLWRPLGWARLDVALAGTVRGDGDGKPAASTVMPVAPRRFVVELAAELLQAASGHAGVDPDEVRLSGVPARARWVAPVRRGFLFAGVDEHVVVGREGLFSRRTHVVPHARVQSLRLSQGPWQRRLGLADLHVDSPPGPVRVRARHRDAGEARRLLVELDERARAARAARGVSG